MKQTKNGSDKPDQGIVFPENEFGKRSSSVVVKKILAGSIAGIDTDLAADILSEKKWRQQYPKYINKINIAAIKSAQHAVNIAENGLDKAYQSMHFIRNSAEMTIDEAMEAFTTPLFYTGMVNGSFSSEKSQSFSLPYNNRLLYGKRLLDQVDTWEHNGLFEASFGKAIRNVATQDQWADLTSQMFVLMGAGSEIAPFKTLLDLGATVIAIDLDCPDIWKRLIRTARKSRGKLIFPIREPFTADLSDEKLSQIAGADLSCYAPEIRTWLGEFDESMTIGAYAYADGAQHIKIAMAMDAIIKDLTTYRKDYTIAFLLTPSDSFAVPMQVAEASKLKIKKGSTGLSLPLTARFLSMEKMFIPHNQTIVESDNGKSYGLSDNIIVQQGPGYILAKNIQKWRSLVARNKGIRVSGNVAPATTTRSVFKNRILAAGYTGLAYFKAEAFKSETTSAMMTAALLNDLHDNTSGANPETRLDHPLELFINTANHGGLWRIAYTPRSVLVFSVFLGTLQAFKRKFRFQKKVVHTKEANNI